MIYLLYSWWIWNLGFPGKYYQLDPITRNIPKVSKGGGSLTTLEEISLGPYGPCQQPASTEPSGPRYSS